MRILGIDPGSRLTGVGIIDIEGDRTVPVFHGVINASAGLSVLLVAGSDLAVGVPGLAGLLVFAGLSAGVALVHPPSGKPASV